MELEGLLKALRLFRNNKINDAEQVCSELLRKNPLDQAAWALKLSCLADSAYVDELENEDVGIAETFLEQNVIAPNARPGTSFQRPLTSSKGVNPILRPTTNAGRPLSGVVRPQTSLKAGSMDQALRTARTAKTARAVSSSSARNVRLGTVALFAVLLASPSMAQLGGLLGGGGDGQGGALGGLLGGGNGQGGALGGLLGGGNGGALGGLLGGEGVVGGVQSALGDLINQLGLGTPNMEGGDGANLLGQALGAGVGIDLLSGPRCSVNETRAKCGDNNEPKCNGGSAPSTSDSDDNTGSSGSTGSAEKKCVPNKCQCNKGFVRTSDGAQCVAQADCGATTGSCKTDQQTGAQTCQIDCYGSKCPTGWVCRKPNICLGAPCRPKCLPNYGVLNVDALAGLGRK